MSLRIIGRRKCARGLCNAMQCMDVCIRIWIVSQLHAWKSHWITFNGYIITNGSKVSTAIQKTNLLKIMCEINGRKMIFKNVAALRTHCVRKRIRSFGFVMVDELRLTRIHRSTKVITSATWTTINRSFANSITNENCITLSIIKLYSWKLASLIFCRSMPIHTNAPDDEALPLQLFASWNLI